MLRRLNQIAFLCCIVFASNVVIAKDLHVTVKLTHIEAKRRTDRSGDKVFFTITEYTNKGTPSINQVPEYPIHWLSKELPAIKNVTLWDGKLQENETVLLVFSLLEQELAPFITEHIGSAQVKLMNKDNKLNVVWGQPHYRDQPKVQQPDVHVPKFIMFGANSQYVTVFKIEDNVN